MSLLSNAARGAALCCSVCLAGGYVYLEAGGTLPSFTSTTQAGEAANRVIPQLANPRERQQQAVFGGSKSRVITPPLTTALPGSKYAVILDPLAPSPTPLPPGTAWGTVNTSGKPAFLPGSKSLVIPWNSTAPSATSVTQSQSPGKAVLMPGSKSAAIFVPLATPASQAPSPTPSAAANASPAKKPVFLPGSKSDIGFDHVFGQQQGGTPKSATPPAAPPPAWGNVYSNPPQVQKPQSVPPVKYKLKKK